MTIINNRDTKVMQALIKDVCETVNAHIKIQKSEFSINGKFPVIDQSTNPIAGYTDIEKALLDNGEYVIFGDHTRIIKYVDFPFAQGADGIKILKACNNVLPKYLYYSLSNLDIPNKGYSRHWGLVSNLVIDVPSQKVQEEIVKILDSFTNLIDALNEELSLRQKQFEYYREKLLTFDDNTNMQKICNFATIQSGKNKERTDNGQFPLFGSTGLISRTNIYVYEGDYILIARVGANAGFTYRVNGKFDVSDNTLIVTIIKNNTINIDYLYHCLIEQNLNKYAKGGGQPLVTSGELKNISIPIPSLAIQQSIVEKLDAFESLISSLKEEIALRQKQYEYYREKLLTFE